MAEPKEIGTVWTLGCEVFVEDALTAEVQEIKVNDIVLSANIFTEGLSVEVGSDRVNAMDLDVRISMDGLKTYIIDSQIVPYEDVLKITDFSPEATNEKRYASSANTSKKIIDSVGELEGRVNLTEGDIDALGKRVDDLELKGTGGSGEGFWYLNEQDGKIHTDIGIVVHGNAIIEGDTSSGGEGQDTPAAGLDEQAILDLLEREKYVTEDDIEGLIPDVDLSEYAKTEDVETAISEVGEEIDSLSTLLLSMWHLDENGNLVTDKQVLIKNNLIIDGDTSSGGEGEDTPSGGISGVKVNGVTYYDDNGDGVIDLGTISGGGGTADLSNYYTKSESDARYLALSGGTISGTVAISGNSITNAPLNIVTPSMGYTGYIRFGAGIDTNELGYLGFSAKGVPAINYGGVVNTLIHSGNIGSYAFVPKSDSLASNVNADNYLSNGVYLNQTGNGSGNSNFPQGYAMFLTFTNGQSNYVTQLDLGRGSAYYRTKIDTWSDWKQFITSDNIGSHNAGGAKKLTPYNGICDYAAGISTMSFFTDWGLTNTLGSYLYGISMESPDASYKVQVGHALWKGLYWRDMDAGTWTSWKKIVTENADGNVLIGTTTDNGRGRLQIVQPAETNWTGVASLLSEKLTDTHIQLGRAQSTKNSAFFSYHHAGDSSDENYCGFGFFLTDYYLAIKANGNVGIGTTDPQYKLEVNGTSVINGSLGVTELLYLGAGALAKYDLHVMSSISGFRLVNKDNKTRLGFYSYDDNKVCFIENLYGGIENCGIGLYDSGAIWLFGGDVTIEHNLIVSGDVASA